MSLWACAKQPPISPVTGSRGQSKQPIAVAAGVLGAAPAMPGHSAASVACSAPSTLLGPL